MIPLALSGLMSIVADVPVDPDRDQGQQWILEELSKPEYAAAKPNWFDQLSKAFWDWLNSLSIDNNAGIQAPLAAVLVVVIIGLIVAAFFIFGKPRINRRSGLIGSLFGIDEERDAESLRRAARAAAAEKDWTLAIEELFRSLARSLAERVLVSTDPGTTAHGFAQRAGDVFPDYLQKLSSSAEVFDDVRYLGKAGTQADYDTLAALERELRTATPSSVNPLPFASVQ